MVQTYGPRDCTLTVDGVTQRISQHLRDREHKDTYGSPTT